MHTTFSTTLGVQTFTEQRLVIGPIQTNSLAFDRRQQNTPL